MIVVGNILSFLQANKRFSVQLGMHLVLATLCLVCGLIFAVYGSTSTEQAVATEVSTVSQVLPPAAVAQLNMNQPANLSPKQWTELSELLRPLPGAVSNLSGIRAAAESRQAEMLSLGDAVFAKFNDLSPSAKDDWRALSQINLRVTYEDGFALYPTASMMQASFLSKTLSVEEVQQLIKVKNSYEACRKKILQSSALIDRLRPVLMSMGLTADKPSYADQLRVVDESFDKFAQLHQSPSTPDRITQYPPPELPSLSFSTEDVAKQLAQPPLSSGNTSNERAGNPNGSATPGSVPPGTLGPQMNN